MSSLGEGVGVYTPPQGGPLSGFTIANLVGWRKALACVRAGTRDGKVLFVGDSTFTGIGGSTAATIPARKALPACLASLCNGLVPSANGLGVPASDLSGAPDNRWTVGTGWTESTLGAASGAAYTGTAPSGSLVYADNVISADTFDVYYVTYSGGGTIGVTATGGSTTSQPTTGSSAIAKVTVTAASAATTNTITITATGAQVYIVGVEPYLSTTKKMRWGNAGVGSATTTNWVTNASTFGGPGLIRAYAPDLTFISLGINDATAAATSATVAANLQTLITAAQISGSVVLMTMPPSSTGQAAGLNEPGYLVTIAALAASNGCAFADWYSRFGSYTAANALGLMSDTVHPNDLGYQDTAQMLYAGLASI